MQDVKRRKLRASVSLILSLVLVAVLSAPSVAHPDPGDGHAEDGGSDLTPPADLSEGLIQLDAVSANVISTGPTAKVTKNLDVVGRGERNVGDATTDVWAYDGFAYTGTFNSPCGGDPEAGIWVWDVHNKNRPSFVTIIQSPTGSRTNDVRVSGMNSGDVLVHSNESCAGGQVDLRSTTSMTRRTRLGLRRYESTIRTP